MQDLNDVKAATTTGIDPQWLALKVRGVHQAGSLAIEADKDRGNRIGNVFSAAVATDLIAVMP